MHISAADAGRRRFLARIVNTIQTVVAGAVGIVVGGAVLSPGFGRRQEEWLPAAKLGDLVEDTPVPVTLRVARKDGYRQVVERRTVFVIKSADTVVALDPTCTHLGCHVNWDAAARELKCPCHGGVYDHLGVVKAGPPPAPLARLLTKTDDSQVFVQV
jgi:Rieske Fe-S protein